MARELGSFFTPETGPDLAWWDSYIFFLGLDNGDFDRTAFYDIQVQTSLRGTESDFELGLRMMKKWDDWMDDYNGRTAENVNRVMVYVPNSPGWVVSSLLKDSGIENMLISLFLAWVVLTYSTGNWITSTLAVITIGMIATIVLGFLTVSGWGLGVLESILIVIVIGFSVDYTVHLADSYMQSRAIDREGKVTDALTHTGMSVLSGAISTILASIPMLFTQIIFFYKLCSCGVLYYLHVVRVGIACHVHVASMAPRVTPSTRCPTQRRLHPPDDRVVTDLQSVLLRQRSGGGRPHRQARPGESALSRLRQ